MTASAHCEKLVPGSVDIFNCHWSAFPCILGGANCSVGCGSTGLGVATTGATGNVTIGSTTIAGLTNVTGVNAGAFTTGVTGVALLANVGTTDATISYTAGAGAVGVLSVTYTQRNPDGTIAPYCSGYTNN